MPRQLDPLDPRAAINDFIIADRHGNQYLIRCPQCVISAEDRYALPSVTIDVTAHEIRANGEPMATPAARRGVPIALSDMPPQLAADVAAWLATQAEPLAHHVVYIDPPAPEESPDAK